MLVKRLVCVLGMLTLTTANVHATDVAVFFALDADLKTLTAAAKPAGQPVKIGGRTIYRLEIEGHRVYAVKMGSGAVETAISATMLLTRFHCDLGFSIGPVGALDDALPIGTWHEVGRVSNYQHGSWLPTGFESAPAAERSEQAVWQRWRERLTLSAPLADDTITVASGEIFVASSGYRQQLRAATRSQAVDMNLFGLAATCADQQVPLFSWRVVSDRADDAAGESFRTFVAGYDGAGGRALAAVIRRLPLDLNAPAAYPELQRLLDGNQQK